jgi:hypothetical protein
MPFLEERGIRNEKLMSSRRTIISGLLKDKNEFQNVYKHKSNFIKK